MSKQRHKFVFFIEPTDKDESASTIGNFYLNRIAIDEDANHEIVNIYAPKKYNIGPTAVKNDIKDKIAKLKNEYLRAKKENPKPSPNPNLKKNHAKTTTWFIHPNQTYTFHHH